MRRTVLILAIEALLLIAASAWLGGRRIEVVFAVGLPLLGFLILGGATLVFLFLALSRPARRRTLLTRAAFLAVGSASLYAGAMLAKNRHHALYTRLRAEALVVKEPLARYERRHGEYPETLEQLVPEFLPEVPGIYRDRHATYFKPIGEHRYTLILPEGFFASHVYGPERDDWVYLD